MSISDFETSCQPHFLIYKKVVFGLSKSNFKRISNTIVLFHAGSVFSKYHHLKQFFFVTDKADKVSLER